MKRENTDVEYERYSSKEIGLSRTSEDKPDKKLDKKTAKKTAKEEPSEKGKKDKGSGEKKQKILSFFIGLFIVAIGIVALFFFVIGISRVDGESMMPTLTNNETLVFFRLQKVYNRGDIVAVDMPNGDYYVKRVIGIEGDEIDIRDGKVYLNGAPLNEPYTQGSTYRTSEIIAFPLTVKPGKVFVLGDNRENSTDSRAIGQVSYYAIPGKIIGVE